MHIDVTTSFSTTTKEIKQKTIGYIPAIPAEWWGGYESPSGGYVNFAKYQVRCVNPKTKRKNNRIYDEPNEALAVAKAKADGFMEPFEVSVLPSRKPTDGQLAYATDLSISLPPGACFEDVSALISRVVDDDEAPVCEELAVAAYCNGWNLSRYSGTKILLELAAKRLPTEEYKELLNNIKQTEGSAFCAACGTNQTVPQQFTPPSEAELLQRIEQGQQENRRLLKSISSSTAILAVVVIIQVLLAFIGLFT